MKKQTKTQSFNADNFTLNLLDRVKKYRIPKDVFIREAVYFYYKEKILQIELMHAKHRAKKGVPF